MVLGKKRKKLIDVCACVRVCVRACVYLKFFTNYGATRNMISKCFGMMYVRVSGIRKKRKTLIGVCVCARAFVRACVYLKFFYEFRCFLYTVV